VLPKLGVAGSIPVRRSGRRGRIRWEFSSVDQAFDVSGDGPGDKGGTSGAEDALDRGRVAPAIIMSDATL